jgi:hypothetical protein
MAVNTTSAVFKTALLAPGGTLLAWAVQQAITGEFLTAGIAMVIGLVFVGGFVVIQERDIPYEDEIAQILSQQLEGVDSDDIAQALQNSSVDIADEVEERTNQSDEQ